MLGVCTKQLITPAKETNFWQGVIFFLKLITKFREEFGINKYGLLTKRETKMAGYWPRFFFACLRSKTQSRSINTGKNDRDQYPAIFDRSSLVNKGFIMWLKEYIFLAACSS